MTDQNLRSTDAAENLGITVEPTEGRGRLPAVIEHPSPQPKRPRLHLAILALLIIVAGPGIGWFWWYQHHQRLPPGIAWGNGRLEADPIDIDTKFAGRIAKLFVDQGDMVKAGQVVAMMDTRDLEASLKKSQAWWVRRSARSTRQMPTLRSNRPRSGLPSRNSIAPAPSYPKASPPSSC